MSQETTVALYVGRIHTRLMVALVSEFSVSGFAFNFFNLLLVRFHHVEIIIVKHLLKGHENEARVGVKPGLELHNTYGGMVLGLP